MNLLARWLRHSLAPSRQLHPVSSQMLGLIEGEIGALEQGIHPLPALADTQGKAHGESYPVT